MTDFPTDYKPGDPTFETLVIHAICTRCDAKHNIEVPRAAWLRWRSGELIQKAFPDLTPGEREILISGLCDRCFEDLYGPEEDDD